MLKSILLIISFAALCLSFVKKKPFIPPGTVQINDSLFADETEISNFSWIEYEMWTKGIYGANSKEHLATLPDTLVWREKIHIMSLMCSITTDIQHIKNSLLLA